MERILRGWPASQEMSVSSNKPSESSIIRVSSYVRFTRLIWISALIRIFWDHWTGHCNRCQRAGRCCSFLVHHCFCPLPHLFLSVSYAFISFIGFFSRGLFKVSSFAQFLDPVDTREPNIAGRSDYTTYIKMVCPDGCIHFWFLESGKDSRLPRNNCVFELSLWPNLTHSGNQCDH